MADTFGLEIYASNKLAFAGRAKTLTIPAVDGEQAFLAQHENIVAAIIPGEMRFEEADGTKHVLAVSSGFVEMINNRVKLFCLTAESPEEIDIRRAQEAKERAEEQMRQKQSIQEYHMNQLALSRAMARLQRVISQKFLLNTCKTPFYVLYYIYSHKGEGQKPLYVAYHHLIAVIKVEIATIASITRYAISKAVGF